MKTYHYKKAGPDDKISIIQMLKKRKIMLVSLAVLIFFLPIAYLTTKYQSKTEAAWLDDHWGYRQTVAITNSGAAQTDFQVQVTVDTATLITAGKMQSNCNDIRITDVNGKVLPIWIEESNPGCNQTTTKIWTKVPSVSTTGTTVFLYYGNPSASNSENPSQVFVFYDNFSSDLSRWTNPSGCAGTISSGVLQISTSTGCDSTPMYITSLTQSDASGYALDVRGKFSSGGADRIQIYQRYRSTNTHMARFWRSGASTYYQEANPGFGVNTDVGNSSMVADTWYNLSAKVAGTNNTWIVNGTTIGSNITSAATLITQTDLTVGLGQYTTTVQYDNVRVRKSATTEPSVAAPSNEQKSLGPVAYWKFDEGYGTNTKDSSPVNHTLNFSGTPSWVTDDQCVSGKCLNFDTDDSDYASITVPSTSPLNLGSSNFTISHWQKIFQPVTFGSGILGRYPHNVSYNGNWVTGISDDRTTYFFGHRNTSGQIALWSGVNYSAYFGKWTHVSWVKSGTTMSLYIDGKFVQSWEQSYAFDITFSGVPFYFSNTGWSPGTMINLMIDDTRIYNYARTAAQIKSDFASKGSGSVKGTSAALGVNSKNNDALSNGLVGYWKMDEASWNGTAGEVLDASGNGNNGTALASATTASGKFGNTGNFDATGKAVQLSSNISVNGVSYTIAAWSYFPLAVSAGGWRTLMRGINYDHQILVQSDGLIGVFDNQGGTGFHSSGYDVDSLSTGWHHLTALVNGSSTQFYIDGVLVGTSDFKSNAEITFIGTCSGGCNQNWGKADDVRVYNRALSPKEVRDLYAFAPGPVGYWNMDDATGSTVYDKSGNGYNSSAYNNPTWTIGKFGKALLFDGNDNVTLPASLTGNSAFTAEAWIYSTAASSWNTILGEGCSGFTITKNTSTLQFGRNCGQGNGFYSGPTLSINTWYHIGMVFDGTNADMYVNGIKYTGGASTFTHGTTYIGTYNGTQELFNGKIDDVRIYNYPRSQKQIVEDMNVGHPAGGSPVGSQAVYYKLDEGYGASAQDSGPNNYPATLYNTPTWSNNGKFGKALDFDPASSEYLLVANTSNRIIPSGNTAFTISMWINPDNVTPSTVKSIASNETYTVSGFRYGIRADSKLEFWSTESGGTTDLISSTTFSTASWYHIIMAYDGSIAKLYINGKLEATDTSSSIVSNTNNITIANAIGGKEYFDGKIDEIKFYASNLTEDEVKLDYNRGASMVLGAMSDTSGLSGGSVASSSATASYCVPGGTDSCTPPVGEWNFEEKTGGNAYDTSGNGNVGTITGATWAIGKVGAALNFDGNDDNVNAGSGSTLQLTSTGTVSLWFKATTAFSGAQAAQKHLMSGGPRDFYFSNSSSKLFYFLSDDATYAVSDSGSWDTNWHFVTATSDGTTVKMYIDGILQVTTGSATGKNFFGNTGALTIGRSTLSFPGQLDQVRIFNYARTQAQIAYDYNRGAPIAHYKLDECQGITANDSSGNGNSGTITIGATVPQSSVGTCTVVDTATAWYNGATGKYNSSLNFDGVDDWVSIGQVLPTAVTTPFTFSSWVNPASAGAGTWRTIVGTNTSFAEIAIASINRFACGQNGGGGFFDYSPASLTITNGSWYLVTCTYDGTYVRIYINGQLVTGPTSHTFTNASHGVTVIGRYQTGGGEWMNGQIDDVRIYNYALTPQQIKQVYNQGGGIRFGPATGSP